MSINRRTFVRSSALGLAAVTASGLGTGVVLADEVAPAAVSAQPEWLGEEPAIDGGDIVASYDCDLLIVGAGCAGLAAAATAAEMGLNFILCDKALVVPETREYLGAVNTSKSLAVSDPVDTGKLLNELSRYASGKCNRDLIKLWIDNSAEMVDWVDGHIAAVAGKECSVAVTPDHPTGGTSYMTPILEHSWPMQYVPPMRNEVLLEVVRQNGYDCWFGFELVKLVHEGGEVKGGIFKAPEGYVQVNAPYTVLATGGYPANPEMLKALQPDTVRCVTANSYNAFNDGSGIKCGLWAGASKESDATPMIFDRGAVLPGVDAGYVMDGDREVFPGTKYQLNIGSQPFLKVNRRGERFANESTPYDNLCFAAGRQPGGVFCQVFDGNAPEDIVRFGMIGCASYTTAMMAMGMPLEDFVAQDNGTDVMQKAETLEELADLLGFTGEDKDTFLATCEHYNELFDAQEDADYGKEAYRLSALRTPPFYGCWYGGSLLTTLDGLRINAKMQALAEDFEPVPGLYAIGDCSGSFFATNYPEYIVGVAAGRSVTEGRQVVKLIAADPAFAPTERTAVREEATVDLAQCADGQYTGTGTGMGGDINVTVEIKNGVLSVIEIGPNNETQGIGGYAAIEDGTYAAQIEAAQGSAIDGIAGATVTSSAISAAVKQALAEAAK